MPLTIFNEVLKTLVEAKAACTSNEKFVATLLVSLPESDKTLSTKIESRYNVTCFLNLSALSLSHSLLLFFHMIYTSRFLSNSNNPLRQNVIEVGYLWIGSSEDFFSIST